MGKGGKKGKDVPCRFFASPQGCSNEACPFLHGTSSPTPAASSSAKAPSGKGGKKNLPCKFYASGRCSNEVCPFMHGSANASYSGYAAAMQAGGEPVPKPGVETVANTGADSALPPADGVCKFFGSAKGCSSESCPFSHATPNSVPCCSFKQRLGSCEKGDICTFRHTPWASAEEARAHYASRDKDTVEKSTTRFKQLHREDKKDPEKLGKEHVEITELVVEREMQVETYGSNAVRMMEKMGYRVGEGLGKDEQGSTRLSKAALSLERASQKDALGFGSFVDGSKATVAERTARLAAARAQKVRRVDETAFVCNNLLSEDESSDDDGHINARDIQLAAKPA